MSTGKLGMKRCCLQHWAWNPKLLWLQVTHPMDTFLLPALQKISPRALGALTERRNEPRVQAVPPYLHHGHVLLGWGRLDLTGHFYHRLHQPRDVLVDFVIGAVQVGRGRRADLLRLDLPTERGCWTSRPQQMGLGHFPAGKGSVPRVPTALPSPAGSGGWRRVLLVLLTQIILEMTLGNFLFPWKASSVMLSTEKGIIWGMRVLIFNMSQWFKFHCEGK